MLFDDIDQEVGFFFNVFFFVVNSKGLINENKDERVKQSIDLAMGVHDVLAIMWMTLALFKNLINFTLTNFKELVIQVMKIINYHVRS